MKKSTPRAESRPSRHLVFVCLFALVASAGCMRGCNCGGCGAPVSCKVDGDCPQRGKCSNGYCTWEADLGAQASACRAGSLCADEGRCGADYKMSFLGLSRETECVAVSDADCRAAKDCKTEGNCALQADHCEPREDSDCKASEACRDSGACRANDGRCEAHSDEDCAPTKECLINDACHANAGHCVLDWSACRPNPGIVGPSWAMPSHRDVERALSTAASFLGWDESGIVDRLRKVDDIDARWRTAESALFEKVFGTATAAGKAIALPSGLKVAVAGRVCGAELAARHHEVDPDHDAPAVQCAVAMSIKNSGDQRRILVVGSEPTLPTIAFVRESSGGTDYHSPTIAYARSVKGGLPRERVLELAPGDEASLLLVGDASFDATSVKDRVLMRVSDWGQTTYLRVDAP